MSNDNAGGKIFNLQTIGYTSVEDLVEIACKATNAELDMIWKDEDQRQTHRNPISEQTDDITITPQISLETGLAETFVWYKNNIELYKEFGV
jgi:nucleoside-diphosphate-sugar epimerase